MIDWSRMDPAARQAWTELSTAYPDLRVTSAYRSPERNAAVGGAKQSQHMHGRAFDISTAGMSREQVRTLIGQARAAGFRGVGVYPGSVHFDTGPERAWGPDHSRSSLPAWAADVVGAGLPAPDAEGEGGPVPPFISRVAAGAGLREPPAATESAAAGIPLGTPPVGFADPFSPAEAPAEAPDLLETPEDVLRRQMQVSEATEQVVDEEGGYGFPDEDARRRREMRDFADTLMAAGSDGDDGRDEQDFAEMARHAAAAQDWVLADQARRRALMAG